MPMIIDIISQRSTLLDRILFKERFMKPIIVEDTHTLGTISVSVHTDHDDSALQFSMSYTLQPDGFINTIHPIEIVPTHPRQHSRSAAATLYPDLEVATALSVVVQYFQYVKRHLSGQRSRPSSFEKWSNKAWS